MSESKNNLTEIIVQSMEDLKAIDVTVLDVRELTTITSTMIIATGQSSRQVKAIANNIIMDAKEKGYAPFGVEGMEQGQWVLVDLGEAIAHIMHPDSRNYYQLEKLWSVDNKELDEQA